MEYVVIAHDDPVHGATRRKAARQRHLHIANKMREESILKNAGAILDDDGQMIGSVMIVDFVSRDELDKWLSEEVYVLEGVWSSIEVKPYKRAW